MRRLLYVDFAKMIGIIMVIMCHIPILYSVNLETSDAGFYWILSNSFGRVGVPLFLMSTGVLVLSKKLDSKGDIKSFYKRNLGGILLTGIIWYVIYYFSSVYQNLCNFSYVELTKTILFINKPECHLWYVRMILIYYALMPFICFLLRDESKIVKGFVIVLFAIICVKNGYDILINHTLYPTTSLLSFLSYFVYMSIGYYINQFDYNYKIRNRIWLDLLSIIIGMFLVIFLRMKGWYSFLWYDNPFLLIASIGVFLLIKHLCETQYFKKYKGILQEISRMTYGIYLCHMLILSYICRWIINYETEPSFFIYLFILAICIFISSGLIILMKQIPYISKILFRY